MNLSEENAPRDQAALEAEATAWLTERDEGFAPGRAAAFDAWRRRDPRHAVVLAELEQVLAQLDGLADRAAEVNARFGRVSRQRPVHVPATAAVQSIRWWRPVAWAGVAAALATGTFFTLREAPRAASESRYTTAAAGYERARLDDGSTLELNAASAARVRFSPAERRVELESGEAHFEVAHDEARPFIVSAGGVSVRAVGTAFNIRVAHKVVEVTVTEGKVSVAPAQVAGAVRAPRGDPAGTPASEPVFLSAHQRLAIPIASVPNSLPTSAVDELAPADMRAALAWQRRVTDFSDTPLAEVAARFNRHHALQLAIADPALGARRISGIFALEDVAAFVRLLERDGIVRTERDGDTVRLLAP